MKTLISAIAAARRFGVRSALCLCAFSGMLSASFAQTPAPIGVETPPASTPAVALNRMVDFQVGQASGEIQVRIDFAERPEMTPTSFSIAQPARLVFDFPATQNALGRTSQNFDQGNLRSANIIQAAERTRVVLNLNKVEPHKIRQEGRSIVISLSSGSGGQTADTSATVAGFSRFAEPPSPVSAAAVSTARSVRDIQFRRGETGEGKVVMSLSEPNVSIDIRRQGNTLVVELLDTQLPEHLRRRSDVTDFATPVTEMVALPQGGNTRVVITPKGAWEHNAYQADRQLVVEFREVKEDPDKLVQGGRGQYSGEKLSLNFQNIEVRSVLQIFADFTNFNIVTSDTVQGTITLRLQDVPWDQALDIILQAKGLDRRVEGNVIRVAPMTEFIEMDKRMAEAEKAKQEKEIPQTETYQINYHKVEDIASMIMGKPRGMNHESSGRKTELISQSGSAQGQDTDLGQQGQSLLSEIGRITYDARSNRLFVHDYAARREAVRNLLSQIDQPPRQVMVEARIVEANSGFARELGVRLGFGSSFGGRTVGRDAEGRPIPQFSTGGGLANPQGALIDGPSVSGSPQGWNVNLPVPSPTSALSMILWNAAATRFIDLELSALEADNRGNVISRPRILTANQQVAEISQGARIPYTVMTTDGPVTQFHNADLRLAVRPRITPDGRIFMEVTIKNDRAERYNRREELIIDQQTITTEVLVDNGGTVVLGGIVRATESTSKSQVPLLGDIPVLGHLFKRNQRENTSQELMVFITPRIVDESVSVR
jgi:type IV pilus assembly protein PilQ